MYAGDLLLRLDPGPIAFSLGAARHRLGAARIGSMCYRSPSVNLNLLKIERTDFIHK